MYSLVHLILYPDVPIGRIICISLYLDVPIGRVINIKKSCKVNEVNHTLSVREIVPTIELRLTILVDWRVKSPQLWGTRVIRLS